MRRTAPNRWEHDDGSEVRIRDRNWIDWIEAGRIAEVECEQSPGLTILYAASVRWRNEAGEPPMDSATRERILGRVGDAMRSIGKVLVA